MLCPVIEPRVMHTTYLDLFYDWSAEFSIAQPLSMAWLMHCENHIPVDTSNPYKPINQWHISHPWISVFLSQFKPQLLIFQRMRFQAVSVACDNVSSSQSKSLGQLSTVPIGHDNTGMAPCGSSIAWVRFVHIVITIIVCLWNCTSDMWIGIPITTLSIVHVEM